MNMDDVSERVNDPAKTPCDLVKLYSGLLGTRMLTHRLMWKNVKCMKKHIASKINHASVCIQRGLMVMVPKLRDFELRS
jgi:hypothetical protein